MTLLGKRERESVLIEHRTIQSTDRMKRVTDNERDNNDKRNNNGEQDERSVRLRDTQEELVRLSFRGGGRCPYINGELIPVF